jgi:hypothetical protein
MFTAQHIHHINGRLVGFSGLNYQYCVGGTQTTCDLRRADVLMAMRMMALESGNI